MIDVDSRIGSVDLAEPLKRLLGTDKVRVTKLPSADFRFAGNGPEGRVLIGVERKRLNDLVSSIQSQRLGGHQMKEMRQDYDRIYLLVEGYYAPGRNGELENGGGAVYRGRRLAEYSMIDNYLTMAMEHGVRVKRSGSRTESAAILANLVRCWSKPWKEHRSQSEDALYTPLPGKPGRRPSLVVRQLAQIDGIDTLAWKLGSRFRSPLDMCGTDHRRWMVKGKIGEERARRIVEMLRGKA